MTDLDLDKLEALAKEATPGPWKHNGYSGFYTEHPDHQRIDSGSGWRSPSSSLGHCNDGEYVENANGNRDAEFIAACGPETILTLIAALREARGEIGRLRIEADAAREAMNCEAQLRTSVERQASAKLVRAEKVVEAARIVDVCKGPLGRKLTYVELNALSDAITAYDKDKP